MNENNATMITYKIYIEKKLKNIFEHVARN